MTKEELIKYDGQEIIYKGIYGVLGQFSRDWYVFYDKEIDNYIFIETRWPDLFAKYKKQHALAVEENDIKKITLDFFINLSHDWWWI